MKRLQLALLIITLPGFSFAQIMVGPKVGLNIASQFKSEFAVPKLGLAYGGAIEIPLPIARGFSVQGEFLVTQKGYKEQYNGKTVFDELTSTYLEIPALAKYTIDGINVGYYFLGGAYWSYWSKGQYQSSVNGEEIIFESYSFTSDYDTDGFKDNRSDFGLVAEAGITYDNLGSGLLNFGVRYSHGLVATNNFKNPTSSEALKLNKVLTISITYFLYL